MQEEWWCRSGGWGGGGGDCPTRLSLRRYNIAEMKDRLIQNVADEARQRKRLRRRRDRNVSRKRAAIKTVAVLPTLLTLGNVLSGFMAIVLASRTPDTTLPWGWTPLTFAALFIFFGMVLDGLDGRVARLTRSTSELGEQLDSMADMVTFGVAPAFLAVHLVGIQTPFLALQEGIFDRMAIVVAFIYVACAALRLARFNIETKSPELDDHLSFSGLPSPGAAGTVASLVLLHQHFVHGSAIDWLVVGAKVTMVVTMLLAAIAMVSRLRYSHVLNRYMPRRAPFPTLVMVVVCLLLLIIYPQGSIAAAFVIYAVSAPFVWLWHRAFRRRPAPAVAVATAHRNGSAHLADESGGD